MIDYEYRKECIDMKKISCLIISFVFLSYCLLGSPVLAKVNRPDIVPYAFTYQDILIKAECADGGGMAAATRGTVMMNARMASIRYEVYNHNPAFSGYWVRSRITDVEGIEYVFESEGYTSAYTVTEYNPSYCRVW